MGFFSHVSLRKGKMLLYDSVLVMKHHQLQKDELFSDMPEKGLGRNRVDEPLKQLAGSLPAVVDFCQVGQQISERLSVSIYNPFLLLLLLLLLLFNYIRLEIHTIIKALELFWDKTHTLFSLTTAAALWFFSLCADFTCCFFFILFLSAFMWALRAATLSFFFLAATWNQKLMERQTHVVMSGLEDSTLWHWLSYSSITL